MRAISASGSRPARRVAVAVISFWIEAGSRCWSKAGVPPSARVAASLSATTHRAASPGSSRTMVPRRPASDSAAVRLSARSMARRAAGVGAVPGRRIPRGAGRGTHSFGTPSTAGARPPPSALPRRRPARSRTIDHGSRPSAGRAPARPRGRVPGSRKTSGCAASSARASSSRPSSTRAAAWYAAADGSPPSAGEPAERDRARVTPGAHRAVGDGPQGDADRLDRRPGLVRARERRRGGVIPGRARHGEPGAACAPTRPSRQAFEPGQGTREIALDQEAAALGEALVVARVADEDGRHRRDREQGGGDRDAGDARAGKGHESVYRALRGRIRAACTGSRRRAPAEVLRPAHRRRGRGLHGGRGRDRRAARPQRRREEHDRRDDRGPAAPGRGRGPGSTARRWPATPTRASARSASCRRTSRCTRSSRRGRTCASSAPSTGWAGPRSRTRIASGLAFVGLAERAADKVKTFSGGMKRRLNLAAGLLHDPKLVLLDEPTVGIDPQSRNAIFDNLESLRRAARRSSTRRTTWRKRSGSATAS